MDADGTENWKEAWQGIISRVSFLTDGRLIWACLTQAIIAGLIGLALHTVFPVLTGFAYIIGATIWTVILCFTPAVNLWFIKPLGNHVVVLEHALRKKERETDPNKAIRLQPTKAYRVIHGPSLTGKSMFESVLGKEAIDLRRALGIKNDEIKVSTGDGANHVMRFWTSGAPIPTDVCLINLARHTESAVVEYFLRSFTGYLQRATNGIRTTDELLQALSVDPQGNHGSIAKGFNELFGGKDKVDPEEVERGMFTGDPKCELTIDPKFQKIRQARPTAALKRQAIKELTDGQNGVPSDIAANMVASDVGDEQPAKLNKFIIDAPPGLGSVYIVSDGQRGQR